jgi:hypothetical protein
LLLGSLRAWTFSSSAIGRPVSRGRKGADFCKGLLFRCFFGGGLPCSLDGDGVRIEVSAEADMFGAVNRVAVRDQVI